VIDASSNTTSSVTPEVTELLAQLEAANVRAQDAETKARQTEISLQLSGLRIVSLLEQIRLLRIAKYGPRGESLSAAQLAVGLFNWRRRNDNPVYQMLAIVTRPVVRLARLITPRLIIDAHVPIVAFMLLLFGFFAIGWWQRDVCLGDLAQDDTAGAREPSVHTRRLATLSTHKFGYGRLSPEHDDPL